MTRRTREGASAVPRRSKLGQDGEAVAVAHVRRLGWQVLDRNWRPGGEVRGELDLVAVDGTDTVFCEVKTRSGRGAGDPLEAVTPGKVRRLRRLAHAWLAANDRPYTTVRFDVIGVYWPPSALAPTVEHRRDVVG